LRETLLLELERWPKGIGADAGEDPALRKRRVEADGALLRLMMAACKRERPLRALELCQLLSLPSSWDGALKVALHAKMMPLAERIAAMKDAALSGRPGTATGPNAS
jgi:hypothetical protein